MKSAYLMRKEGLTPREMGRKLFCTEENARKILKRADAFIVGSPICPNAVSIIPEEIREKTVSMYNAGSKYSEIMKATEIKSESTIRKILKGRGVPMNRKTGVKKGTKRKQREEPILVEARPIGKKLEAHWKSQMDRIRKEGPRIITVPGDAPRSLSDREIKNISDKIMQARKTEVAPQTGAKARTAREILEDVYQDELRKELKRINNLSPHDKDVRREVGEFVRIFPDHIGRLNLPLKRMAMEMTKAE